MKKTIVIGSIVVSLLLMHFSCASRRGFYHQVRKGETLYRISKAYDQSIERVARANNMRDLGHIREGQYILIPEYEGGRRSGVPPKDVQEKARRRAPQRLKATNLSGRFIWPLAKSELQKIALNFGKHRLKKHSGVDIHASLGEQVRCVAGGQVIYTGDDVKGSGKTVVVRHPEEIFSIYSQLRSISVQPKQKLKQGDLIGEVGQPVTKHFNQGRPLLHFEIRERLVPVNPENLLP